MELNRGALIQIRIRIVIMEVAELRFVKNGWFLIILESGRKRTDMIQMLRFKNVLLIELIQMEIIALKIVDLLVEKSRITTKEVVFGLPMIMERHTI